MKSIWVLIVVISLVLSSAGCKADSEPQLDIANITAYVDTPGITPEEIEEIESLKATRESFSCAQLLGTEAFIFPNGAYGGFSIELYNFLSQFFGVRFVPKIYDDWDELKALIDNGVVDFSSDFTPTEERAKRYYMTYPVAERSLRIFGKNLDGINLNEHLNGFRIGFLSGTITADAIREYYPDLEFQIVEFDSFAEAARMLEAGEFDIFVEEAISDPVFEEYGSIVSKEFFPLVYTSVSLTTTNPELKPIISVLNKYISAGGIDRFFRLYAEGNEAYTKHKLSSMLTDEEKEYLDYLERNNIQISVGYEHDNYPICFYNEEEGEFQGIAVDVLNEISGLSGIKFRPGSTRETSWSEILNKLKTGEISMTTELLYSETREGDFIWADNEYHSSHFAFVSKMDYPDLNIYQVVRTRVGAVRDTVTAEMYNRWFPEAGNLTYYDSHDDGFDALESGEIDLFMATENLLLYQTNYREKPGYKVNIRFNSREQSRFGFNKNEVLLRSIIDKTQTFVKTTEIANQWSRRLFDYAKRMAEERSRYLSGFIGIMFFIIIGIMFLLFRNYRLTRTLEAQTGRLATVYRAIPDLLFCKDLNSAYTSCNPAFEMAIGFSEEEIIGRTDTELFNYDEKISKEFQSVDKAVMVTRQMQIIEEQLLFPDGSERFMETHKVPLMENGKVIGLMGISRDITERKAAEEAVLVAARAKSAFLANMSHEIRTPMNSVIGMTELLLAEKLTGRKLQYVKDIKQSAESLLVIINDILDMSKIDEGKLAIMPVDVNLHLLLKNIASMIGFSAFSKSLMFIDDIQIGEEEYVRIDDIRLNQILVNLLSNAVKFTKAGHVKFSARIENDKILFDISDTGVGIKPDEISLLFSAFQQVDMYKNRAIKGTGLGLSIAKNLAELMGGDIWVESEYGVGTQFHVELPYVPGNKDAAKTEQGETEFHYISAPTAQILLVDDIHANLTVGLGLLRLCGINADAAISGYEAIELARQKDYDIVFMDHMMPVMDGVETMAKIRELGDKHKKTPIIALTANAINESRDFLLNAGMDDFLSKPINKSELMSMLQKWLPADKIKTSSNTVQVGTELPYSDVLREVAKVGGVDVKLALNRLDGMQDVLELSIKQIIYSMHDWIKKMDKFLTMVNFKGFAVEAHGFKGALSNIGAMELSEQAASLEIAAKNGNLESCIEKFSDFAEGIEAFVSRLLPIFPEEPAIIRTEQGDPEFLESKQAEAIKYLDEFEAENALMCLDELMEFTYGEETDKRLRKIKEKIEGFDYDLAMDLLGERP